MRLNQRLLDEYTDESKLLRLSIRKTPSNRFNKTSAATELYEVDSVLSDQFLKNLETNQVWQLFVTAIDVVMYAKTEVCISELFLELFSKRLLAVKYDNGCISSKN